MGKPTGPSVKNLPVRQI